MDTEVIAGIELELDCEGYLNDHTKWNREIAQQLANKIGLGDLSERHFAVIDFMRSEYESSGQGPSIRALSKRGGIPTKELYELFPDGPAKKAALVAGIPKPKGCI